MNTPSQDEIDVEETAFRVFGTKPSARVLNACPALAQKVADAAGKRTREYAASRVAPAVESTRAPRASRVETR